MLKFENSSTCSHLVQNSGIYRTKLLNSEWLNESLLCHSIGIIPVQQILKQKGTT